MPKTLVIEAGRSLAVSYAGALLRDMGFEVKKLTPKTAAPHPDAYLDRYHSYYDVYDHGKEWQVVEDVRMATSAGFQPVRDQVEAANPPGSPLRIVVGDRDYLDRALMRELSAGAVALWFSDAGRDNRGPESEGEVSEALLYFGSGTALLCREAASWPRTPDVPVASLQTGLIGALLAVAMLGGPGTGLIDVSGDMASLVFTSVMYVEEVLGDTKPTEREGRRPAAEGTNRRDRRPGTAHLCR